ncbi:hypothetical protein QM797_08950 [Rhodococcus sp. IEGM 1381]|uniref:insulinase family protein n=1 Tax=Rhodococcus sp. IEGM 1381 TaxID=3047085 RepID=UPI0024B76DCD|nr:insulinase family protein [Rhodococcus sp. IEGM 1381]MDI9894851.1 hypothetical protein [Rhodococcus sp. IEGM 1381]
MRPTSTTTTVRRDLVPLVCLGGAFDTDRMIDVITESTATITVTDIVGGSVFAHVGDSCEPWVHVENGANAVVTMAVATDFIGSDFPETQLVSALLGSTRNSLLIGKLREQTGIAYEVWSGVESRAGRHVVLAHARVAHSKVRDCVDNMTAVCTDLEGGVPRPTLTAAAATVSTRHNYAASSGRGLLSMASSYYAAGVPLRRLADIDQHLHRLLESSWTPALRTIRRSR